MALGLSGEPTSIPSVVVRPQVVKRIHPPMPEKSPNSGKSGSRAGGSVRVTRFELGVEKG
jgi:hypothetical protein